MIDRYAAITGQFPVHLIEDGLGEDDDDGWIALTARLGATTELVGDDIFCTNPAIITRAIERGIGNSALIKLNQSRQIQPAPRDRRQRAQPPLRQARRLTNPRGDWRTVTRSSMAAAPRFIACACFAGVSAASPSAVLSPG